MTPRLMALALLLLAVSLSAQTPTNYVLAVFPPGTVPPMPGGLLPAATAPTPVVSATWTPAQMTCGQPSVTATTTPLSVTATSLEAAVFDDPASAGLTCRFNLSALLQPQITKLTPGLIYPVGVQATTAAGGSDWDLSSNPFQRPAAAPAAPTHLVLIRSQ